MANSNHLWRGQSPLRAFCQLFLELVAISSVGWGKGEAGILRISYKGPKPGQQHRRLRDAPLVGPLVLPGCRVALDLPCVHEKVFPPDREGEETGV